MRQDIKINYIDIRTDDPMIDDEINYNKMSEIFKFYHGLKDKYDYKEIRLLFNQIGTKKVYTIQYDKNSSPIEDVMNCILISSHDNTIEYRNQQIDNIIL